MKQYFGFENYLTEIKSFELRKSILNYVFQLINLWLSLLDILRFIEMNVSEQMSDGCCRRWKSFLIVCKQISDDRNALLVLIETKSHILDF